MKMTVNEAQKLFAYKVDEDGGICIYGYKGDGKEIEFPSEIGGRKVTHIGNSDRSKYDFGSLEKVIIPDSVISIGGYAFAGCESLTSITIPNSVTSIGNGAFKRCKSLASVTIPNSVTSIGKMAFCDCESLENIQIPDRVSSVGYWAFVCCTSLKKISLPYRCIVENYAIPEGVNVEFV